MFRPIRRKKKEISTEAAKQLLHTERRGVLAVCGDEGYPYAIPINFYYKEETGKIYFHGARAGHKVDALKKNDKVCFTIYGNEQIKKEPWAPFLQSTVVFGRCRMIEDQELATALVREIAGKYYPDAATIEAEIAHDGKAVQIYEITIEHLSGKEIQEK